MKAFIFDFDGVVVDSERHWDSDVLPLYQSFIPGFTAEHDRELKGRSVVDLYDWLSQRFEVLISKEEYHAKINRFAEEIYSTRVQLIPGFSSLVTRIRQMSVPTSVASSGTHKWIDIACEKLGITECFDAIVTAEDVGIGKPDPAVYREAAMQLQVPPADCVALEDSTNGIQSAKAAGMYCIAIRHTWGHAQDLSAADKVVDHYDELDSATLEAL